MTDYKLERLTELLERVILHKSYMRLNLESRVGLNYALLYAKSLLTEQRKSNVYPGVVCELPTCRICKGDK